jgi:hypothetical protein
VPFLGWYDPDKKRDLALKLADAVARYEERAGVPAEIALMNPSDAAIMGDVDGVEVRSVPWVPVNTFYVGVTVDEGTA